MPEAPIPGYMQGSVMDDRTFTEKVGEAARRLIDPRTRPSREEIKEGAWNAAGVGPGILAGARAIGAPARFLRATEMQPSLNPQQLWDQYKTSRGAEGATRWETP